VLHELELNGTSSAMTPPTSEGPNKFRVHQIRDRSCKTCMHLLMMYWSDRAEKNISTCFVL
jgi:hypothetical protein